MENQMTENPYLSARREWNERYGQFVKAADFWRKIALWCLLLLSLSVGGLIYIGSKSKFVPYVLKEDGSGRITGLGFPSAQSIDDRVIRANLSEWIGWHRSVVSDAMVQRQYVDKVYSYLIQGSPAKTTIDEWYLKGNDPFKRMETSSVSVQVQSVLSMSEKSYQIEWDESLVNKNGQSLGRQRYRALLSIEMREVDQINIVKNPLGIFISTISIQQIGG